MRFLLSLLATLALTQLSPCDAHAKLNVPAAWNPQPSTTKVCGLARGPGADPAKFKVTTVDATQLLTVSWSVVVGDGVGPISATIEPTAKINPAESDFTVALESVGANNPSSTAAAVNPYLVTFRIPANTRCTGRDNTCTLRVISKSNWVACATIQIVPPATPAPTTPPPTIPPATPAPQATTPPPTTPPAAVSTAGDLVPVVISSTASVIGDASTGVAFSSSSPAVPAVPAVPSSTAGDRDPRDFTPSPSTSNRCVLASGLSTCSLVNGQTVQLTAYDALTVEAQAVAAIESALTSALVFKTPSAAGCRQAVTELECAKAFPPCRSAVPVVCSTSCQRVASLCQLNTTLIDVGDGVPKSHADLYDCNNANYGFNAISGDTNGACPDVTTGARGNTNQAHNSNNNINTIAMAIITLLTAFVARV